MEEFFEDLRVFIGGFFLIVGLLLTYEGSTQTVKTGDLNLNLFAGAAFIVFAIGAVLWATLTWRRNRANDRPNT